jgi:septum formation protein
MSAISLWRDANPLILASKSAIRATMLRNAGLPVLPIAAAIDERALSAHLDASTDLGTETARHLAQEKALAVSRLHPDHYVIGADQTLALDNHLLHKPATFREAKDQLKQLSGQTHRLTSAAALALNGEIRFCGSDQAHLTMRVLTDSEIMRYLEAVKDDALTSVGAYQLEGLGIHLFERIEGDYFTILGLPLLVMLQKLREMELIGP